MVVDSGRQSEVFVVLTGVVDPIDDDDGDVVVQVRRVPVGVHLHVGSSYSGATGE